MPKILCEEYLDVYEGIQSEIVNTIRFDENSDLSTTFGVGFSYCWLNLEE